LALILIAGSCSQNVKTVGSEPRVFVLARGGGGDAQITGEIRYLKTERCFVLERRELGSTSTSGLVWPPGTQPVKADSGAVGVRVNGATELLEGAHIEASGEYISSRDAEFLPDVPAACVGPTGQFAVVERM